MPTMPAPANVQINQTRPATPPAPPTTLSSSQPRRPRESVVAAILFIISLLLLCGLIGVFVYRSTTTYKLDSPTIAALPATTNSNTITVEGTAPKNATIEISSENNSYTTTSDKNGYFNVTVESGNDGKHTYYAIARKRMVIFNFESNRSNEVFTVVDKTAPNLKIVALPKTVTSSKYTLKGTSSEKASIKITASGKEYSVNTNKDLAFSQVIDLREGDNAITVVAKDDAGNQTSTATLATTYRTGSVYIPDTNANGRGKPTLPDSSGELSAALSTVFGRAVAISAVMLGILGYFASTGVITLLRMAKKEI